MNASPVNSDQSISGFCVEYEIKESPGLGRGLFAKNRIPVNTLIWKFSPGKNVRLFKGEDDVRAHLETLNENDRIFWLSHVYLFDGYVNEILDDGKLWNHSECPNTSSGYLDDWDNSYSIRDIEAGEELLDDYGAYEYPIWFMELCKQYNVPQDFFIIKETKTSTTNINATIAREIPAGFQISYKIKESSPELGMGIFTKEFIPKGTLIWKYVRGKNVLSYKNYEEAKRRLSELSNYDEQYFWMSHVYMFDGNLNEILDDAKMWNHNENPNTGYGAEGDWESSYAIRDILPGEELLDDYGIYEYPEWFVTLAKEFNVPQDFITKKVSCKPGFHINTEVIISPDQKSTLIAKQFIPQNTLIWNAMDGINVRSYYTNDQIREYLLTTLPPENHQQYLSSLHISGELLIERLDDARFTLQHPSNYNCVPKAVVIGDENTPPFTRSIYSLRDIQPGEALVEQSWGTTGMSSSSFETVSDWILKLFQEFKVDLYNVDELSSNVDLHDVKIQG